MRLIENGDFFIFQAAQFSCIGIGFCILFGLLDGAWFRLSSATCPGGSLTTGFVLINIVLFLLACYGGAELGAYAADTVCSAMDRDLMEGEPSREFLARWRAVGGVALPGTLAIGIVGGFVGIRHYFFLPVDAAVSALMLVVFVLVVVCGVVPYLFAAWAKYKSTYDGLW